MEKKIAIVAFGGQDCLFAHVLLNVWDYHSKGYDTALILEGAATGQLTKVANSNNAKLWEQIKQAGLVKAVCRVCAKQNEALEAAEQQQLPIDGTMAGHSPIEPYTQAGYEVILF